MKFYFPPFFLFYVLHRQIDTIDLQGKPANNMTPGHGRRSWWLGKAAGMLLGFPEGYPMSKKMNGALQSTVQDVPCFSLLPSSVSLPFFQLYSRTVITHSAVLCPSHLPICMSLSAAPVCLPVLPRVFTQSPESAVLCSSGSSGFSKLQVLNAKGPSVKSRFWC